MSEMTIEMLSPEQVNDEWDALEPMLDASCKSNEVGILDITPDDIRILAVTGLCVLFIGRESGTPKVVVAIQFNETNGHKGADVIAMGGERLMKFKDAYWNLILDWLKANGCEFLDAYANERLAKIYMGKFGFNKSCSLVRMTL
jgi:hypothetical protein